MGGCLRARRLRINRSPLYPRRHTLAARRRQGNGGRAITEYLTKGYGGSKPVTVSFSNYEFYGNDRVVTEVSDTEIHDHDGKLKYRGKQTLIFLKQGGAWKLHRDMWNDYGPLPTNDQ